MARKQVITPDRELGLDQPVRPRPVAKRRVRRRQVARAPLWQTYSGLRPWKGKTPTLRPGERAAEQPLFMRYSGLGLNQPERSRAAAGRDPNYAMRYGRSLPVTGAPQLSEAQQHRRHEVGMAREAREGGLIERREAAYHRAREQLAASGVRVTPEVDARLRKSYGLAGVPADEGQPSRRFGEYTGGRPMPGKVTGTQQTIYGELPKNYYERQREMMGRGLVYVRSMNKWMTPEMRDELSRHKWGKVTQEHLDRIERGDDRGFFNISTPSGETLRLTGDQMRAITQLGKGAIRGEIPEGLQLTREDIAAIRRYHRVVERSGEAARLEQAEAEYEGQLDRLGEWQDVAGAGEPGRGMANIREGLMERATGALDEVDVARGAIGEARPEFRDRMAMLDQIAPPGGVPMDHDRQALEGALAFPRGPMPLDRGAPVVGAADDIRQRLGAGQVRDRLTEQPPRAPAQMPTPRGVPEFRDRIGMLEQAPLPVAPRPTWLSPTDDLMVDEKAWMQRIDPYLPKPEPGLPAIPQKRDVGQEALEQQFADKKAQDAVSGTSEISQYIMGGGNSAAALAAAQRLIASGVVDIGSLTRALYAQVGEGEVGAVQMGQIGELLKLLGRSAARPGVGPTGQPLPGVGAPGQVQQILQPRQEPLTRLLRETMRTMPVGWWYSRDDFREPIIAQLNDPQSALGHTINSLLHDLAALPVETQKRAVTETVYNSLFNALDDYALTNFGANSKTGDVTSATANQMMWVRPENFASDVAGSVNRALEEHLSTKLGL